MRGKIDASHLARRAFVYVRQSTASQVFEHQESARRQYSLAERARQLGWASEAVEVIDEDQGKSGATTQGRNGIARLAQAVAHGEAGAVLALEVSRLARSSEDWRRLLSLCAVAQVAVIDEQTVYDPSDKDDKLLLDLKGTMSEAELHWLSLRLYGARQSKARRGALRLPAPTGYIWGEHGFELDPDEAVQRAVRLVFERYEVEPSGWAVVRWARERGLKFPTRRTYADGTTEVDWKPLGVSRVHELLRNPVYAGVYVYGRRRGKAILVDGEIRRVRQGGRDPDSWLVRIEGAHRGYISWERYLSNQEKLRQNQSRFGGATRGAPREGEALLCGLLVCGRCGRRMRVSYGRPTNARRRFSYRCAGDRNYGQVTCWSLPGEAIDRAVEALFLEVVNPGEIELSLAVEREVESQSESLSRQWQLRIEQAQYEARLAERRYKAVDPDNRVVARTLEQQWEKRLRELEEVEKHYQEAKRRKHVELSEADHRRIRALARDLSAVWRAPSTSVADRKAMLRLVIEAISLTPVEVPRRATRIRVQWQGGALSELETARPDRRQRHRTALQAVQRIRQLAQTGERDERIAESLNKEGIPTARGNQWSVNSVKWVRRRESIQRVAPDLPRRRALPERHPDGRYSIAGAASRFGISVQVVRRWLQRGIVAGSREDYEQHRGVWWIEIDEATSRRLEKLVRQRGSRRSCAESKEA